MKKRNASVVSVSCDQNSKIGVPTGIKLCIINLAGILLFCAVVEKFK